MSSHLLVFAISILAGALGSLLGLGGGIIVIPALTLLFHIDIRYAIGASIVAVIATSSGAAAAYVRDGLANLRVAMVLELATTSGALTGAYLAGLLNTRWLYIIFGIVMGYSALVMYRKRHNGELEADPPSTHPGPITCGCTAVTTTKRWARKSCTASSARESAWH